jgi:hypothetical protein
MENNALHFIVIQRKQKNKFVILIIKIKTILLLPFKVKILMT